jgi:hypothetical protein
VCYYLRNYNIPFAYLANGLRSVYLNFFSHLHPSSSSISILHPPSLSSAFSAKPQDYHPRTSLPLGYSLTEDEYTRDQTPPSVAATCYQTVRIHSISLEPSFVYPSYSPYFFQEVLYLLPPAAGICLPRLVSSCRAWYLLTHGSPPKVLLPSPSL